MNALTLGWWLCLSAVLTPALYAQIEREQAEAVQAVERRHGDRPPSEREPSERAEIAREQAAALQAVLARHQIDGKAFARYGAGLSRAERAQALEARAALDAKAHAGLVDGGPEIPIQRGFSNQQPIELEAADGAPPVGEEGTPGSGSSAPARNRSRGHGKKRR